MTLVETIDAKIGEVRTESLDLSVGEIIALHQQRELEIRPDFQRLFRWSFEQRSRLIESLLLELPIPSIFVIERGSGVLELIDGLQRISSILHFVDAQNLKLPPDDDGEAEVGSTVPSEEPVSDLGERGVEPRSSVPLVLEGCDVIPELNGHSFDQLPLTLRLRLKRTPIRTVIIKRQSSQFLRYEMFKRLNTGGSKLSDQDIRNVNARMFGDRGTDFYERLRVCSKWPAFVATTELLSTSAIDTRANEELVLRFFACIHFQEEFKGNVGDWLDSYMEAILLEKKPFDEALQSSFYEVFNVLAEKFGPYAFVKYRDGAPRGGVAPAHFEAVVSGASRSLSKLKSLTEKQAKNALAVAVESEEFRKVTGPGANSLPKLKRRIEIVSDAFNRA
jgi:hypothetical protein